MTDPHILVSETRLAQLIPLAAEAGKAIMGIYSKAFSHALKDDKSPVTDADTAAEAIILAGLAAADPQTPVISEEAAAAGHIPEVADTFYLVDPLDGTREFISRNGEFTVNIALIENGRPCLGVVYAPARGRMFCGHRGRGAVVANVDPTSPVGLQWKAISVNEKKSSFLRIVASRSHRDEKTEAFIARLGRTEIVAAGSSLKFCLVATGEADLYPRFGRTMEWDTAAGQAVLEAAGGAVVTEDASPLLYGKRARGFDNPAFIAGGADVADIVSNLLTKPR